MKKMLKNNDGVANDIVGRINFSNNLVLSLEELNSRMEFSSLGGFLSIADETVYACDSNITCAANVQCDKNACDCNTQCDGNSCDWNIF